MRDRWIGLKDYPEVWKVFSALKKTDDLAVVFEKGGAR